jgi:hypothetical protein
MNLVIEGKAQIAKDFFGFKFPIFMATNPTSLLFDIFAANED